MMLGFELDIWDYLTFLALLILVVVGLAALVFVIALPGRIAIARHHPEAEAVNIMGLVGFLAVVPWIQALIWAFKPVNVVDIRYMPDATQRETNRQIAHLTGKPLPRPAAEVEPAPTSLPPGEAR